MINPSKHLIAKSDTLFAYTVQDGYMTSHDPRGGLANSIRARVEVVALPVLAVLDTVQQLFLTLKELFRWSVQFLCKRDERSIQMATRHFELCLRSIAAIGVGIGAAITGLTHPAETFESLCAEIPGRA